MFRTPAKEKMVTAHLKIYKQGEVNQVTYMFENLWHLPTQFQVVALFFIKISVEPFFSTIIGNGLSVP